MIYGNEKQRNQSVTYFVVFLPFITNCRFGLAVDLQWHTDVGRDKLPTPPHLMIFSGIIPTMIFLVCYIVWYSFVKIKPWCSRIFSGLTPIWIILSGMITSILGNFMMTCGTQVALIRQLSLRHIFGHLLVG